MPQTRNLHKFYVDRQYVHANQHFSYVNHVLGAGRCRRKHGLHKKSADLPKNNADVHKTYVSCASGQRDLHKNYVDLHLKKHSFYLKTMVFMCKNNVFI